MMTGTSTDLLLLTMNIVFLNGSKRFEKMIYEPYGPKMCAELCGDLVESFRYTKLDLTCHQISSNDQDITNEDSFTCRKTERTANVSTPLTDTSAHGNCSAYFKGQTIVLQQKFGRNVTADDQETNPNTTLHQASKEGNLCLVMHIVSRDLTDIDCLGEDGRTPVMVAAYNRQVAVFDYLLRQGCDLTAVDDNNNSVLHEACYGGSYDIVKSVVETRTFDLDIRGVRGLTPIMLAAIKGHKEVYDLLSHQGCNLTLVDYYKRNILHLACQGGKVHMVRDILSQNVCSIDSRERLGRTPLMIAAMMDHRSIFDLLVENGCNVTAADDQKDNILHLASVNNKVDMVEYILSQELVDEESRGCKDRTALMMAAGKGHVDIVKFLSEHGCNPKSKDYHKNNILHLSCVRDDIDTVTYILAQGLVDVESRGFNEMTAVMMATMKGHIDVVRLLLEYGCNPRAADYQNNNILHFSCVKGDFVMVQYILTHNISGIESRGSRGRTPVIMAAVNGSIDIVKLLVRKGCNVRAVDDEDNNILHVAASHGHAPLVDYIVSNNMIDIESRGYSGLTAVLQAAVEDRVSVIDTLRKRGCNVRASDEQQENLLHIASRNDNARTVRYLLKEGIVSKGKKNIFGDTPLDIANRLGQTSVVVLLKAYK